MTKIILVVDDQRRYRQEIIRILQGTPVKVVEAEDGLDGLTKFRKEKPDVVVIDAMLPKLHGFQLAKAIRQSNPRGAEVSIIIMSGLLLSDNERNEAISRYGADDFLAKPFEAACFLTKIHHFLQGRR